MSIRKTFHFEFNLSVVQIFFALMCHFDLVALSILKLVGEKNLVLILCPDK